MDECYIAECPYHSKDEPICCYDGSLGNICFYDTFLKISKLTEFDKISEREEV